MPGSVPPKHAPQRSRIALLGLFFLSGASGLIDQVIWVRHLSVAFGSTAQSVALVTSIFLGGLGVGALLAGRWADRGGAGRALKAYALCELLIGLLGLALSVLLPMLADATLWPVHTQVGTHGWHEIGATTMVLRALTITALLGPSTLLMGATLTLLIRAVVDVNEAGWWVGWLYGLNTLGAAFGALGTDLWWVPLFGLRGTLWLASGLNLVAALGTLALTISDRTPQERPIRPSHGTSPNRVALALFLAGFAAMGMELAWFRFLGGALGPYRAVFSMLLATMLLGLFLGATAVGPLLRVSRRPALWFTAAQLTFAVCTLWYFADFDPEDLVRRQRLLASALTVSDTHATTRLHGINLATIAGLVLVPATAMGASFPLGNAMVQDAASKLGHRAGTLYLATTLGNVIGAIVVGFAWLPGMGLQQTVAALATIATLSPLALGRRGLAGSLGLIAVLLFCRLPADQLLWATFPANRVEREGVLNIREGVEQILVVTGRPEGPARLWTGGHPMTSTSPHAQRYMRLMAHVPLLMTDAPKRVLVICFGVGNTLSAAALHPSVTSLHAVDLSRDILEQGHWFEHANHGILDDARVSVFVNDGRHHLRTQAHRYDLITLEPPPIGHVGISTLYSVEFYEQARSRLTDDGVLTQWLPAYQVSEHTVEQLVTAFAQVFPNNAVLVASGRELVLVGSMGAAFSLTDVDRRIAERPDVAGDLRRLGAPDARQLAALYAGTIPDFDVPPLTDDRPSLEYSQVSHVMETSLPPRLFDVSRLSEWCVDCAADPQLQEILTITSALYRTEDFLQFSNLRDPDRTSSFDWTGTGSQRDTVAHSASLRRLLFAPRDLLERALELRQAGEYTRAQVSLDAAFEQSPDDPDILALRGAWATPASESAAPP